MNVIRMSWSVLVDASAELIYPDYISKAGNEIGNVVMQLLSRFLARVIMEKI